MLGRYHNVDLIAGFGHFKQGLKARASIEIRSTFIGEYSVVRNNFQKVLKLTVQILRIIRHSDGPSVAVRVGRSHIRVLAGHRANLAIAVVSKAEEYTGKGTPSPGPALTG